ncbi:hypothetical protein NXY56_003522 [Leishmania guyanensis]|uniref:Uncharacterized protein n=3 Tax=Viannia TaxID=37616 RepID=A0AAW3BRH2_9TRYP|nr:unnamed protein product [Leishmania braziliensis]CAJ2474565.1 unnamed protein product [Leishmania braziliensis]SYZ66467.1 hypothetical_protein [Leishmania braziliensis MHOM/BR/75/M2904]
MHPSSVRYGSIFHSQGAAGDWFGRTTSSTTWRGAFTSFALCLFGIAVINQFCRGNPMGRCEYENEIVMLLQRSRVPPPDTYGFVDAKSEEGRQRPPPVPQR